MEPTLKYHPGLFEVLTLARNPGWGQCMVCLLYTSYVESNEAVTNEKLRFWMEDSVPGLQIIREGRAGQVYYHLLEMKALSPS